MGGYELIYPLEDTPENEEDTKNYAKLLHYAQDFLDPFNSGKRRAAT